MKRVVYLCLPNYQQRCTCTPEDVRLKRDCAIELDTKSQPQKR